MADVKFICPHCNQPLEAPSDMAGQVTACPQCQKSLRIPVIPTVKPGSPQVPQPSPSFTSQPPEPQTSGMAIASMVLGILGLVTGLMCFGFPMSLLAVILGHLAFSKISRQPQRYTGKGMAIAGFAMGYVGLMFAVVAAILWGTLVGSLAAFLEALTAVMKHY